eukprot:scaffold146498_cov18-Prasinocladus_malaysianus.AAC.1
MEWNGMDWKCNGMELNQMKRNEAKSNCNRYDRQDLSRPVCLGSKHHLLGDKMWKLGRLKGEETGVEKGLAAR